MERSFFVEVYEAAIKEADNKAKHFAKSAQEREPGYSVRLTGATHFTFGTDVLFMQPVFPILPESAVGKLSAKRAVEVISAYVLAFFDHHLLGHDAPLLNGESAAYPEVKCEVLK